MATSDYYDLSDETLPVFVINGFLEAGKTEFIKFTMQQDYFKAEGRTLLLVCEEGDTEYSQELLDKYNTVQVKIDEESQLNREYLEELEIRYNPVRIIMEWNGMWNQDDLYDGPMSEKVVAEQQNRPAAYTVSLPSNWVLYQTITIMDGSTLDLYLGNLKSYLGQMLRNAELALVNRCDGISSEKLVDYRRKIRAMGRNAMIVLEDKDGEIPQETLPEDLPFDISQETIQIPPEAYGVWFVDCMDNPERYLGKTVEFSAMVLKRKQMTPGEFVPGRMAMTCCAADMTFLGFVCRASEQELKAFETRDWVKLKATVDVEEREEYRGEGPVLTAVSMARTGAIEDVVSF